MSININIQLQHYLIIRTKSLCTLGIVGHFQQYVRTYLSSNKRIIEKTTL